jgi:hypothetical protein
MRRREFIALLGAAIARPRVAHARNRAGIARIGICRPSRSRPLMMYFRKACATSVGSRGRISLSSAEVVGPTSNAFRRLRSNWRASR